MNNTNLDFNEAFHIKEEIIEFEDENESNLNESQFNPGWNFTVKNEGHSQNITETAHYFDVIRFKKEKGKEDEAYLPYSNEVEEEGEACSSYANEENTLQKLGTSKDFCEFNEETQRFPQFKYRKRKYVGEKSKKFKCNLCSYEGHTLALLRRHRLNHFAEKRFQCSQCDFRAYFQSYVTVHEVVHAKTKKSLYKCSNCSFVAKFRKSFITHCRKHLREKGPTKRISQNTYTRKKRTSKRKLEKANENVIVKERYSKRLKRLRKEKDISDSGISFDIDDNDSKEKSRTGIRQSGKRGRTRKNPNDSNSVISLVRHDDDIKEKSLRNDPRSRNKRIGKNKDDSEISFQMGNGNYLGHHDPQSDKRRTRKKNNDPGLKISSSNDDDLKEELPVYNEPRFRKENDSDSVSFHKNDSKEESGHEVLQSLKKRNSPKKKSDSDSKFSQYFADDSKEESGHGPQSDKKRTSKKQSDSDSEFPFNIDDDEDSRQDDIRKSTTKIENRKTVRRKLRRDQSKDAIHLNKISDSNSQIATRRSARKRKSNSDHLKVDYSAAENLSTISHNTELIGNDEDKNTLSNTRVADYNRKGRMINEKEIAYDRVETSPSIGFIADNSKEESRGYDLQSNSITKTRRSTRNMSKNDQSTVMINLDSEFREETIHQDDQSSPKRVRRGNTREKNPGDDKSKVHQFDSEEDSIKISENQNSESEREGNHRTHTLMSKSTNFEISFEEDLSSGSELYEEWMDEYLSSDYENDGKRRACKRKTSKKISVSTELLNDYDSHEEFAGEDYDSQTTKRTTSTRLLEVQSKVTHSDTSHNYDLRKESSCGDPNSDLKRNKRIHKRNLKNDQAENSSILNENSDYESDVESLSQAHSSEIKSRDGSVKIKINKPRDDRGSVSRDLDTICNFNKDFLSQELHSDIMSLGTIGDYAVAEDSEINIMSVDSETGRQNTRKEDWEDNQMKTLRDVDQINDNISKESIQGERSPDIKNNTRSLRCRKENCVEDESKITPQLNPVFEFDQVLTPAQDELHSDADADELELRDDDMPKEALPHLEDTSNNDADKMKYFTSIFEAGDTVIGDDSIQQLFFMEPKVILRRKKILSCNKCYFLSSSVRLMRKHKLGHFTSKKFNCSACDFTSSTKRALSKHHTEIHKGMVMTIIEDNAYNDKNGNNNNRDDVNSKGNDDNSDEDCDEKDEDNHDYNDNDENCDDKDENNVDYREKILNRTEENLLKENSFKCTFCDFSTSEVILGKIHLLYHEMANLYFSMKRDFGQEIDESEIDKLFPDDPLLLKYLNIVSQHSVPITCPEYDSKDVSKCANNLDIIERPQRRGVTDFSKVNDVDINNCKFKGVQNTFDAHERLGKFRKESNIDEECGILEHADNESSIPPWYDKFPEHNNIRTEHDDNVLAEHDDMSIEHDNNLLTEHMSIEHDNNVLAKHDDNVPTKHDDNKCQESPEKSFVDNNLISDDENRKDLSTEGEINLNYSKIKCTNRFLRKKMYRKSFFKCDFPLSRLKSLSACSTVQGKDEGHSQILTHEKETVAQSDLPLPVRHSTKGQSNKLEMSEDFDFEGQSRYSDFLSTMKVFVAGLISQETSLFNVVNSSNSIPQCSLDLNSVTSVNTNCHDNGVTKQTVTMENIIDGKDISLTQYRGMLSNSRNSDEVTVDIPEGSLSTELPAAPSHSLKESIILREHATHNHSVRRNKSNGNGVTAQSIPPVNSALPYQNAIYDSILNALEASLPLHQRIASEIMNSDQRSTRGAQISHINKTNREEIHPNQISSVEIGMPRELPQSLLVPPQNSSSMGIMNQSLPLVTEAPEQDIRYRTLSFDNAVSNVVSPLYRKQLAVPQCNKYNNGTAGTFSRRPTMIEDPDEALVNQNSTFNKMVSVRGVPFQSDVIMRENNSLNKGDDSMLVIPEKWNINVEIARTPSVYVLNKEMPPNPALIGSNANSDKTTFSSHSEKEPFPSHFKKETNPTQSEIKREIIETRKDFKQASLHELLTLETEKMTERQTQMELQALLTENYGCSAKESFNATGMPATKSVEQYSLNFVCGDGADLQPSVSPPVLISKDDEDVEYAQKKKNPKKPNIYECDECDYKGAALRYLTAHKLTHQKGRRKFVCSQCSYSTFRQYDMKKHLYTHSAFKKFECCFCDFSTNEKSTMKKHMNTKHAVTEKS